MDLEGASEQQMKQLDGSKPAVKVKPFRPVLDRARTYSKLTNSEMKMRAEVPGTVELDLQNPESSAWLKTIFEELEDQDPETRYFALRKFESVLHRIVLKGSTVNACFSAYMLEQGILKEIIRILKSAKAEGDIYMVSGGSMEEAVCKSIDGLLVLSKVKTCLQILNGLMADARTWRFVKKSIPDLLFILEGSYLSENPVMLVGRGKVKNVPPVSESLRDEEKLTSLETLGGFALWATDDVREVICGRRTLLSQIYSDCLADTKLASDIVDRVITTISVLDSGPRALPISLDDFFKVAVKAFEVSQDPEVIRLAINNLAFYLKERPAFLSKEKKLPSKYLAPLLALATCSSLEEERKGYVYKFLCLLDHKTFSPILTRADYKGELEKILAASSKALDRKRQLCDLFASDFNREPGLEQRPEDSFIQIDPIPSGQRTSYVTLATEDEFRTQRNPCRKCSRTECSKKESASGEFKLCSKCRLAIYCSRECQTLAWKEGHKTRCRAVGSKATDTGNAQRAKDGKKDNGVES